MAFGSFLRTVAISVAVVLLASFLASCSTALSRRPLPEPEAAPSRDTIPLRYAEEGIASWYGPGFHGRPTASGERYDQNGLTAAHRTLPFGTRIRVTNLRNGRTVTVRVTDRGPFVDGRILDLSLGAAQALGFVRRGTVPVRIESDRPGRPLPPNVLHAVQAGSFRDPDQAERLEEALHSEFRDVYVTPWETEDLVFYRVRLGPFMERTEAAARARALRRQGVSAMVVEEDGR